MGDSIWSRIFYWLLILGYLNWFYGIGASLLRLIKESKNRMIWFRFGVTLLIPWFGGILYWLFPLVIKDKEGRS